MCSILMWGDVKQRDKTNLLRITVKYLLENRIFGVVGLYFIFSIFLKSFLNLDFCIPCLWKTIFDFNCPGCGLTTALIYLTQLNFTGAFHANRLIFVLLPLALYHIGADFNKFVKETRSVNL